MDRASKLKRLNAFRRTLPHCSASALAAIIAAVQEHGVPDGGGNRKRYRDARNAHLTEQTPHGPVIQRIEMIDKQNNTTHMCVAHPVAYLWKATKECEPFRLFLRATLLKNPPNPDKPWNIVLYSDEVTPGNPLATLNQRKFQAVYWSFLEFGTNALSHEEAWLCLSTEYSIHVNEYSAGLSQAISEMILLFFNETGTHIGRTGVLLPIGDDGVRVWAVMRAILQDGGAHKATFHSRGDGANKFCLLCSNEFTHESEIIGEDGSNLLTCRTITRSQLELSTGKNLRKNARYIARRADGAIPPGEFTQLQQALGLTHHAHSLLLNAKLDVIFDPVDAYVHDPMHGLFSDGVCNIVLYLLLESCIQKGKPHIYEAWSAYIAPWRFPARLGTHHMDALFTEARKDKHRNAKHIKCQASDMMSLMFVAGLFVHHVIMKLDIDMRSECAAFVALVDVIELVLLSAKVNVTPDALLVAIEKFLKLFVEAWGYDYMIPKFHWMLHYADILRRMCMLLMCFCLERKHRTPKRFATDITNPPKRSSESLLMEVVSTHLIQLCDTSAFNFEVGLVKGSPPSKATQRLLKNELGIDCDLLDVQCGHIMRFSPLATCSTGDVVLFRLNNTIHAGTAHLHVLVEAAPVSLLSVYSLTKQDKQSGYSVWTPTGESQLIESCDILDVVMYTKLPDDRLGVLLSAEFR